MPRIRSVHPDICLDETLALVSAYAERTFVRLWIHLDDKGRGVDNPLLWAGILYPLHPKMTEERVEKDLAELEAHGLIQRYEVGGRRLLCAKPESWARYQKPQKPTPSKIPAPPPPLREDYATPTEPLPMGVEGSSSGGKGLAADANGREPSAAELIAARMAAGGGHGLRVVEEAS